MNVGERRESEEKSDCKMRGRTIAGSWHELNAQRGVHTGGYSK